MDFSAGSCVRFGWDTFKKRPWFFIGAILLTIVVSGIASRVDAPPTTASYVSTSLTLLGIAGALIGIVASILVKMGTIQFFLKAHDAPESAKIENLWAPHPFWTYIIASIVVGVIVVIGVILLIIPGIIWGLRYMFVPYIVMDKRLGVSAALSESARITSGHKWELFILLLIFLGLNILGAICLIVGLLVSVPVTYLATVHAYRVLQQKADISAAA